MKWSIRIGNLFGIPLFLHVTFFLFLAWIGVESWRVGGGASSAIENVLFICTLFACVVLHELGHALTARRYGIATRDITLLPIGGIARLDRMPDDPKQELWVALAGPAVNFVIAAVAVLIIQTTSAELVLRDGWLETMFSGSFVSRLLYANLMLLGFNLLPAFPMDGGRVLRALLATHRRHHRPDDGARVCGMGLAARWQSDVRLHRALRLGRRRAGSGHGADAALALGHSGEPGHVD
jgi:Zn-dependent protease